MVDVIAGQVPNPVTPAPVATIPEGGQVPPAGIQVPVVDPGGSQIIDTANLSPEKAAELIAQKQKVNEQNQAYKTEIARLQAIETEHAGLKAKQDAADREKMDENERLKADLAKSEATTAAAQLTAQAAERKATIAIAGIDGAYQTVVDVMLREAIVTDPNTDKIAWFASLRESQPALFAATPPAVLTAGGTPTPAGGSDSELSALDAEKTRLTAEGKTTKWIDRAIKKRRAAIDKG